MPQAIAGFRASHPGVEVTLAEGEPEEIAAAPARGRVRPRPALRVRGRGRAARGRHPALPAVRGPTRPGAARRPPAGLRRQLRLEDLREESWVQTSAASPCARHVVRSCHAAGFEPRVSFESDDYLTVQGLVAAGVGVALIPQLALAAAREDIAIRELTRGAPCARSSPRPRGRAAVTPAVATMLDILREVARTRGEPPPPEPGQNETAPGRGGGGFVDSGAG